MQQLAIAEEFNFPKRPPLRYFGGKWRIAAWLIRHFPEHRDYCTPYGGGWNESFQKLRPSGIEVYNDINISSVNFMLQLRDNPKVLIEAIAAIPRSREAFEISRMPTDDPIEAAARYYIYCALSVMGGGGQDSGTSDARLALRAVKDDSHLWPASWRLQGVGIEHVDALDCIRKHDSPETLFYCDPAYPKESLATGDRTWYLHHTDTAGHRDLANLLNQICGMAVVSGYKCSLYDEIFAGWRCLTTEVVNMRRADAVECIWIKPHGLCPGDRVRRRKNIFIQRTVDRVAEEDGQLLVYLVGDDGFLVFPEPAGEWETLPAAPIKEEPPNDPTAPIVAAHPSECDAYGGRSNNRQGLAESKWHNPFVPGKHGTLPECLQQFKDYLLGNRDLMAALSELAGQRVGCHCAKKGGILTADDPVVCHVQILAKAHRGDYSSELKTNGQEFGLGDRVRVVAPDLSRLRPRFGWAGTVVAEPTRKPMLPLAGALWVLLDGGDYPEQFYSWALARTLPFDHNPSDHPPKSPDDESPPPKPTARRREAKPAMTDESFNDRLSLEIYFLNWLALNSGKWEASPEQIRQLYGQHQIDGDRFRRELRHYCRRDDPSRLEGFEDAQMNSIWGAAWTKYLACSDVGEAIAQAKALLKQIRLPAPVVGDHVEIVSVSNHSPALVGRLGKVLGIQKGRYRVKSPGAELSFYVKNLEVRSRSGYLASIPEQSLPLGLIQEEIKWLERQGDEEAAAQYRLLLATPDGPDHRTQGSGSTFLQVKPSHSPTEIPKEVDLDLATQLLSVTSRELDRHFGSRYRAQLNAEPISTVRSLIKYCQANQDRNVQRLRIFRAYLDGRLKEEAHLEDQKGFPVGSWVRVKDKAAAFAEATGLIHAYPRGENGRLLYLGYASIEIIDKDDILIISVPLKDLMPLPRHQGEGIHPGDRVTLHIGHYPDGKPCGDPNHEGRTAVVLSPALEGPGSSQAIPGKYRLRVLPKNYGDRSQYCFSSFDLVEAFDCRPNNPFDKWFERSIAE